MSAVLYHLVPTSDLEACKKAGKELYFPRTYEQDGFTHLTANPQLLLTVANQFYQDTPGEWKLMVLDTSKLQANVKYEPAAAVGDKPAAEVKPGEDVPVFPHLYGGIDLAAISEERSVQRAPNGAFLSIEGV